MISLIDPRSLGRDSSSPPAAWTHEVIVLQCACAPWHYQVLKRRHVLTCNNLIYLQGAETTWGRPAAGTTTGKKESKYESSLTPPVSVFLSILAQMKGTAALTICYSGHTHTHTHDHNKPLNHKVLQILIGCSNPAPTNPMMKVICCGAVLIFDCSATNPCTRTHAHLHTGGMQLSKYSIEY